MSKLDYLSTPELSQLASCQRTDCTVRRYASIVCEYRHFLARCVSQGDVESRDKLTGLYSDILQHRADSLPKDWR